MICLHNGTFLLSWGTFFKRWKTKRTLGSLNFFLLRRVNERNWRGVFPPYKLLPPSFKMCPRIIDKYLHNNDLESMIQLQVMGSERRVWSRQLMKWPNIIVWLVDGHGQIDSFCLPIWIGSMQKLSTNRWRKFTPIIATIFPTIRTICPINVKMRRMFELCDSFSTSWLPINFTLKTSLIMKNVPHWTAFAPM